MGVEIDVKDPSSGSAETPDRTRLISEASSDSSGWDQLEPLDLDDVKSYYKDGEHK